MILNYSGLKFRGLGVPVLPFLIILISPLVHAKTQGCPPEADLVQTGFRAYQFKGVQAAVSEWTYKSSFADPEEVASLIKELTAHRNFYGDIKAFRTLGVDPITPNTRIYYMGAGHDRGELFFKFIYYCEKDEWVLSARPKMQADPDNIFSQNFYLRSIKELQEKLFKKGEINPPQGRLESP